MKKVVSLIAAAGLTAAAILGAVLSGGSGFWFASAAASVLCCIPFFLSFEKRAPSAGELVLIAVMTAFSAAGRFIFAPVPFFKPVSAIVALAARHLGPQVGFMIGALSAVISNIWFGQGPWTPFQMLCWGLVRSHRRDPRKTRLDKQTASAVHFRNRFRNRVLVHHGRVDGSFNERQFLRGALDRRDNLRSARNGCVLRIKRSFPASAQ